MAARYSVGVAGSTVGSTANLPIAQFRSPTVEASLKELWIMQTTAPAGGATYLLTRPATQGTQTATALGQAEDPADAAATGTVDTAWSVNPTKGTNALRPFQNSGSIGQMITLFFDQGRGLIVPAGGALLLTITTATTIPALILTFVWEE